MGAGKKIRIGLSLLASLGSVALAAVIEPPPTGTFNLSPKYIDLQSFEFDLAAKNCNSKNCEWWSEYVLATRLIKDPSKNPCGRFLKLGSVKEFPLRSI